MYIFPRVTVLQGLKCTATETEETTFYGPCSNEGLNVELITPESVSTDLTTSSELRKQLRN